MPRKGFYVDAVYYGLVYGEYLRFPTEAEYIEFIEELESESKHEVFAS